MLGFLKNMMRKLAETPAETPEQPAQEGALAIPNDSIPPTPIAKQPPARNLANHSNGFHQNGNGSHGMSRNGKGIEVPLQGIIASLPLELHPRVLQPDVGDLVISVPLEKILSQLARGVVKISFGELRQAAAAVFSSESDRDRVLVPLPLGDILAQLNPTLITRRRIQKRIEVPAEIRSPFDAHGQGLVFTASPGKAEVAPAPVAPAMPAAPIVPAAPAVPLSTRRFNPVPLPTAAPIRSTTISAPTPTAPASASPSAPAILSTPRPAVELRMASAAPLDPPPLTATPAAVPANDRVPLKTANEVPSLAVSLTAVAESWPENIRKEIVHFNLVDATIEVPVDVVAQSLKQGRLAFSWKSLRSWIQSSAASAPSALDSVVLELPLKIVAPLFLARQRENNKAQQKVSIDNEIPNLFFGFPQAETSNPPPTPANNPAVAKPVDTNYYVWDDTSDTAHIDASEVKRGASPGTRFVARYATPNEVVSRAAALEGVAGSLIALPDGLMVASRLSSDLNGDTLAAFLPQIFGKVSQCTKELRMGELNNLNFTVGNIPWKIFRVNAIFFAAFGRAGEALPTAQLAALAAELDHKPK